MKLKFSKNTILSISFILLIIFSAVYLITIESLGIGMMLNPYKTPRTFRIDIESDEDFKHYDFPGSGTIDDPYIIENYTIISDSYAISINGVSKYCIIRNNILGGGTYNGVLYLSDIRMNIIKIYNNSFIGDAYSGSLNGIKFYNCANIIFERNKVTNFFYGITTLSNCDNLSIRNNSFKSFDRSLYLTDSENINIHNNTFYLLKDPYYNYYYGDSIFLSNSKDININNNMFHNSSLAISYSTLSSFHNNTINSYQIGFFHDQNNFTIDNNYGQIIMINCNYVNIKNQKIAYTNDGILLRSCNNCYLNSSTLYLNLDEGINALKCDNLTIDKCLFNKNLDGIGLINCDNSVIQNSTISNNGNGLFISSSTYILHNTEFLNNKQDVSTYPY
ncbi:MAG: right-handed parallel beta-helix repeat-containing protein [Candidatus Lokiarchaeota archaeon]